MLNKLIKSALIFTAGAAAGAAGVMFLMSDSGKEAQQKLRDLASQAKDKIQDCYEQIKQEVNAEQPSEEQTAAEA